MRLIREERNFEINPYFDTDRFDSLNASSPLAAGATADIVMPGSSVPPDGFVEFESVNGSRRRHLAGGEVLIVNDPGRGNERMVLVKPPKYLENKGLFGIFKGPDLFYVQRNYLRPRMGWGPKDAHLKCVDDREYVTLNASSRTRSIDSEPTFTREQRESGPQALRFKPSDQSSLGTRFYWVYGERVYSTEAELSAPQFLEILRAEDSKKRAKLEAAITTAQQASRPATRREPISDDVKMFVWQRDGGRCVKCGSSANLEFDHVIPLAMGGSNTARNLQLLCGDCNRAKGASLV